MNECHWGIKPCVKEFVLCDSHLVLIVSKWFWEKWYSSPPWPFYSRWPGIPHDTVTSFWPARALSSSGSDFGELVTRRKQVWQCFAMCTQSPASMGMCSRQAIKAGLAIKPINRDRMNQPNPLLTCQGNHPLPFHSEPGTPFRMLYARQ